MVSTTNHKLSKPKIINVFRKELGCYYVYSDQYYWDSEADNGKGQTRHIRHLIGKRAAKDSAIEYNNRYKLQEKNQDIFRREVSQTLFMGEYLVLEKYIRKLGLRKQLTEVFGKQQAEEILTLVAYAICTQNSLSWCGDWMEGHGPSKLETLSSQRVSVLLERITIDKRNTFLKGWMGKHLTKKGYFCFDSSNVISYGKGDPFVEYGYSHGHKKLPQKNLAILTRQENLLPVWFGEFSGSKGDVRTVGDLLKTLHKLKVGTICFTMDKGYYSEENIELFESTRDKFIMPIPMKVKWQYDIIDACKDLLLSSAARHEVMDAKGALSRIQGITKVVNRNHHRYYVHVYYNSFNRSKAENAFMELVYTCRKELKSGNRVHSHEAYYERFFTLRKSKKKGLIIKDNLAAQSAFQKNYSGYWCLQTNYIQDPARAYEAYAGRNGAELIFDDWKHEIDGRTQRSHKPATNFGRLFINFISMIILNTFKEDLKKHREGMKLAKLTGYKQVLYRMSTLSRTQFKGTYKPLYAEPTKTQRIILDTLKLKWPQ